MAVTSDFTSSELDLNGLVTISGPTALVWGPDGRLYVTEVNGDVNILSVAFGDKDPLDPVDTAQFYVTDAQVLTDVKTIQNYNDDGTEAAQQTRQVTGIDVTNQYDANGNQVFFDGKPAVVIYVTSSDSRIGGGSTGADEGLDTNSGVITRLTEQPDGSFIAVDIVRGLPRSEENHATNGLEVIQDIDENGVLISERMIVASGGNANTGAPSNNFAGQQETPYSAAILEVDLDQLNAMPVLIDGNGRSYIYDIPSLDDPTRVGAEENDPFGGNDGLNSGVLTFDSPVQIYSSGYRNSFDVEVTEDGRVWTYDNGANDNWGGRPAGEDQDGDVNATEAETGTPVGYIATNLFVEDNNEIAGDFDPQNWDGLHEVTRSDDLGLRQLSAGEGGATTYTWVHPDFSEPLQLVYGGHPNPTRAEGARAGLLYTPNDGTAGAKLMVSNVAKSDGSGGETSDFLEVVAWLLSIGYTDAFINANVVALEPGVTYSDTFATGFGGDGPDGRPSVPGVYSLVEDPAGPIGLPLDIDEIVHALNPVEGDYREAGYTDGALDTNKGSVNGLTEYTSTILDDPENGITMSGALWASTFSGSYLIIGRNADGIVETTTSGDRTVAADKTTIQADGGPLGLASIGDDLTAFGGEQAFQGTVWAAIYKENGPVIEIFQPGNPDTNPLLPVYAGQVPSDPTDNDLDGIDHFYDPFEYSDSNGYALAVGQQLVLDFQLNPPNPDFSGSLGDSGLLGAVLDGGTAPTPNRDALTTADGFTDPAVLQDGLFDDGGNLIIGANAPLIQIKEVADGTAVGLPNTLRDGLQTGVRIESDVERLVAEIDITNWTADQAPAGGRKTGLMFGDGTQSNFVRLFFGDIGSGVLGLEVGLEVDDVYTVLGTVTDAAFTTALTAFSTTEEKIALGQKVVSLQLEIKDIGVTYEIAARYAIKGETGFTDIPLSGATLPEGVLRAVLDGTYLVSDADTSALSGASVGLFAEKNDGVDFTAVDINEIRIEAFGNELIATNASEVGAPGTDGTDTVIYTGTDTALAALDPTVENFDGSASSANYTVTGNANDNVITVGLGTNTITTGAGADVIKGTLSELAGDTITDFSSEDTVVILGFSTDDITGSVTYSAGSAIVTINGQSLTFDGPDFEGFEAADGPLSFTFTDTTEGLSITSRQPLSPVVAINAGGTGAITGTLRETSLTFVGDEGGAVDGAGFTTPGATNAYTNATVAALDFPGTDLDDILESERTSPDAIGYEIDVPNGTYLVDLIFAEIYWGIIATGGSGSRVFDGEIEGIPIFDNLDIFDEAGGAGLQLVKSYQVDVTDGSLSINLPGIDTAAGEVDQNKLSGLVVWSVGGNFVLPDTTAPVVGEITLANPLNFNDGARELTIVLNDETGFASIDFVGLDGSEVTFIGYTPDAISAPTLVLSDGDKTATLTYNVTGEGNAWADGVVGEISFAANAVTDAAGNGNEEASGGFVVQPNLDSLERGAVVRAINLGTTDAIVGTLDPDQAEGGATDDNSYGGALTDTIITDAFGNFITFEADSDAFHTSPKASLNANVDGAAGTTGSNSGGIDLDGSAYHTYRDSNVGSWTSTYTGFANGSYIVELHFAELFHATEAEARVGDFTVNGRLIPEAENYNAFASAEGGAGADRPSLIRVPVTVTDGTITVDVQSDVGEAGYSAIVIYDAIDPNLPPSVSVGDVVVAEGGLAEVTFTRSGDLSEAVTIAYSVTPGTAQVSDFGAAAPNPVVINVGESTASASFQIIDDVEEEGTETIFVTIDSATVPSADPVTISDGSGSVTIQPSDSPFQAPVGVSIFDLDFEGVSGEAIAVSGFDGTLGDDALTLDEATSEITGGKLVVQSAEGDIGDAGNNASLNDFTKTVDVSDPALAEVFLTTRFDNPFTAAEFASQGIVDGILPTFAQQGIVFGTGGQGVGEMVKLAWGGVAADASPSNPLGVQMWSKGESVDQQVTFAEMVQAGTDQFDVASIEMSLVIDKVAGTVGMYVTLFDATGAILGGVRPEATVGFATATPQAMPQAVLDNLISVTEPTHFGVTSTDNSDPETAFESFEATWDFLNLSSPQFTDPGLPPTISVGDILVAEGDLAEVTFTRTGDLSEAVTIAYSLTPDTAQAADFGAATPNPVVINAGEATATMSFQIIDDGEAEGTETITVSIDSATVPSADPVTIADGSATVTIEPSDFPPDSINGIPVADGDFSDIHDGPRDILVLAEGATEIVATQQGDNAVGGRDRDFITFTVAAGQELTGIVLKDYTGGLEGGAISQGFIAIQEGPIVSYDQDNPVVEDVALLLGSHIYNESDVQGVNFNDGNILDEMGSDQGYGSIGFAGPLGAGTYTLWLNQGADEPKTVTLDLVTAPVPPAADFTLALGAEETGDYGNGFNGTTDDDGIILGSFTGTSGDLQLTVTGFDIETANEVEVLLNGERLGFLGVTGNNGIKVNTFEIADGSYLAGENILTFQNKDPGFVWGITDITVGAPPAADFTLALGAEETGDYGNGFNGTTDDDGIILGSFTGTSGDLQLTVTGFDIETANEVEVLLNGERLGFLGVTGNNGIKVNTFEIADGSYLAGENILTFQNKDPGFVWGITDITVGAPPAADFTLALGAEETGDYGNGFNGTTDDDGIILGSFTGTSGDLQLTVTGFDIETANEVEVLLNGERLGFLDVTGNNGIKVNTFEIADGSYLAGENILTFQNKDPGFVWGITDITVGAPPAADFTLALGAEETGDYGNGFNGTTDDDGIILGSFTGTSGDLQLTVTGFDIETANEVEVLLNGERLGFLGVTGNNGIKVNTFEIADGSYLAGENILTFQNKDPGFVWGITDITVGAPPAADFTLALGAEETGDYGNGFNGTTDDDGIILGSFTGTSGDLQLTVTGFDIETANEVEVLLNGERLGFLDVTGNNGIKVNTFEIADGSYLAGENILTFQNKDPGFVWGITDITVGAPPAAGVQVLSFSDGDMSYAAGLVEAAGPTTFDFTLALGAEETGDYGNGFNGTTDDDGIILGSFTGTSGDLQLTVTGFDIETANEVEVLLNGERLGFLGVTGNNGIKVNTFEIADGSYLAGENILTFQNKDPGFVWGITDITVGAPPAADFTLALGAEETGDYGNGFNGTTDDDGIILGSFTGTSGDLQLTVTGFDIETANEVEVLLNGERLGFLGVTGNNGIKVNTFEIADGSYLAGENILTFQNKDPGFVWGITDITVGAPPAADFTLALGAEETGDYGNGFNGTTDDDGIILGSFTGTSGDLQLTVTGFDIETANEVEVLLNGERLGFLGVTGNNGIKVNTFEIADGSYLAGENILTFQNKDPGFVWGITDITVGAPPAADFTLALGAEETGDYGNGFNGTTDDDGIILGSFTGTSGDLQLTVTGFDIETANEVEVLLNGERLGFLGVTGNNGIKVNTFEIADGSYLAGENILTFQNKDPGFVWGITDIKLEEPPTDYRNFVIFGDSLSDNGNFTDLAADFFVRDKDGELIYTVPFQYDGGDGSVRTYDTRAFTDGTAYADTLAGLLSLDAAYENYAFGGAEALGSKLGASYINEYSNLPYTQLDGTAGTFSIIEDTDAALAAYGNFDINLTAQVDRYLGAYPTGAPADTLAVLNIGANDLGKFDASIINILFGGVNAFAEDLGIQIETQARRLADNGVSGIALYTLPVAEFFIGYDDLGSWLEQLLARDLLDSVRDEINFRAQLLNGDGISTEVVRIDIMSEEILADMQTHGFLYQGPYLFGYSGDPIWTETSPGVIEPTFSVNAPATAYRPEQILFFDQIHPSVALHDMLAIFSNETLATDEVFASGGADVFSLGTEDTFVLARSGNDEINLGAGDDVALGGTGNDTLRGEDGSDLLIGGAGSDRLEGGAGSDLLAGSAGDDQLFGGDDADMLIGGLGSDSVFGDGGDDVFIFFEEALWGGSGGSTDLYDGGAGDDDILFVFLASPTESVAQDVSGGTTTLTFGDTSTLTANGIETIELYMGLPDDPESPLTSLALSMQDDLLQRYEEGELWGIV